jgi:signal transduction histidine kinase
MKKQAAQERITASSQLECTFNTQSDGVIACDREGKILRINAAALKLFEVASERLYRGTPYQQFLHSYEMGNDQQPAISLEPWLMSLITGGEATPGQSAETVVLQVPSGRKINVNIRGLSVLDAQKCAVATVYIFYDITQRYQQALHLQRVQQAVSTLKEAIAHIPEQIDCTFPEGILLLSPPVFFVAQQLVDVIGQVLDCQHVFLLALGPRASHLHYVVGSGFTSEQEQCRRKTNESFLLSDFVDEAVLARLSANQEVILPADRLRLPPGFREDVGSETLLVLPLFLEDQLSGALVIARAGFDSEYTPEEIELVKAVATKASFIIECLLCSYGRAETPVKALAQEEMHRLIDDFLNVASHELNTPLTTIKGNIQLAQRRLAMLKRRIEEQPERVSEKIEQVQSPLASAAAGTRLQERVIKDLIDDARIQANTLELHLKRCDLIALLKEAIANQQRAAPERTIVLHTTPAEEVAPVIADAERITQVINSYLANALSYSPADQSVTVQLTVEGALARVSAHGDGPGIPLEELGHIWERLYYAKGIAAQHESDLGLGSGLYLSQVFVERHHGSVGVQSDPDHGVTFWFTLPIEASAVG